MSFLHQDLLAKLDELVRLLDEAYDHWLEHADDHHSKSSEGVVQITLPTYWARREPEQTHPNDLKVRVAVYSYVLGPSRMHYFDDIDEALATVRGWHGREMQNTYLCHHGNKIWDGS